MTDLFEKIGEVVKFAIREGIDGVEVFEPGTLKYVSEKWPHLNIHVNGFFNIFNPQSVNILKDFNVVRILPSFELNTPEVDEIKENFKIEVEVQVHGKIPLGYAEGCILTEEYINKSPCSGLCYEEYFLKFSDKNMRSGGRVPWSGKDVCFINELPKLISKDYRIFRIEGRLENNHYREKIGKVYMEALLEIAETGNLQNTEVKLELLKSTSKKGLCNGYYYKAAGDIFVEGGH